MAQAKVISSNYPEREVRLGSHEIDFEYQGDTLYIYPKEQLQQYPQKLTDRLIENAQQFPERTFVAKRGADGEWIRLSYAEVERRAWHIAQAQHQRDLSAERPIIILSGNDLEHLVLSMAAMFAGVPFSAISPAYSLVSQDFGKLHHVIEVLTPGLVYAADGQLFAKAIQSCVDDQIEVVTNSGLIGGQRCTAFDDLLATPITDVKAHYASLDEHTIAKFLFTSGSTKMPKAVPTTHLMLCVNQQMLLQTFPEFADEPPVLLDWLSWHHTFGGSHNVGIVLYNAGTIYIDDGKPVAGKFDETIRNLKEISPTVYFNVPKGWEELTIALENDKALRDSFYAKVKILFFAGAALSNAAWDRLDRIAQKHCGESIRIMSGLGMTETAPSCAFTTGPQVMAGFIGYPAPGCTIKLERTGDKLEFCAKGDHVMKGYWRLNEDQQSKVFDDEGFYHTSDAVRLVDPEDPQQGLMYDGRLAEDFKLNTGTFVNVGTLRNKALLSGNQLIQDLAITGSNLDSIGFLIFPKLDACAELAGLSLSEHSAEHILSHDKVRYWFQQFLQQYNQGATGSSNRVDKLYLMTEPPQLDASEVTDKGNLNQGNIIKRRQPLIEDLYQSELNHPLIIRL